MDTLIELFDSCQLENIASFLKFSPKKVVFVGFSQEDFDEKFEAIADVAAHIRPDVKLERLVVKRFDYEDIKQKLETVIKTNKNCYFDLTGGKELVLVAMGPISTKYKVPMYQIDLHTNKLIPIDHCGSLPAEENLKITLSDSVTLNCSEIKTRSTPVIDREFFNTVEDLWSIANDNSRIWKTETMAFILFEKNCCRREGANRFSCEVQEFYREQEKFDTLYTALNRKGYITVSPVRNSFVFRYKNKHIRPYLEKSGNILETYTYSLIKEMESERSYDIHDVSMQVELAWLDDGKVLTVTNELDVVFMKGVIPVFVSCKSGILDKNSLYELNTVAERLGGKYAKKILIAAKISPPIAKKALQNRAEELGITLISDASELSRRELIEEIKKAINGAEV